MVRHRLRKAFTHPYRFAVWGNNAGDVSAREALIESIRAHGGLAFAVVTGDLTQAGTTSQLERAAEMYDGDDDSPGLGIPWFATVGDRDVQDTAGTSYVRVLGRSTFAFDAGALRLIVLDSADAILSDGTHDALDEWLPADAPLWWSGQEPPPLRMVLTHVPPFEPFGGRGDGFKHRPEAARVLATLQRNSVLALVSSHLALFEEETLAGVPMVYSGGGGADLETLKSSGRHWLEVTVESDAVSWEWVGF